MGSLQPPPPSAKVRLGKAGKPAVAARVCGRSLRRADLAAGGTV